MTTKALLAERIRRILSGGFPSDRDRVKEPEIILAIGPAVNKILKVEALSTSFVFDGGSTVGGTMLANFDGVPVRRSGPGRSEATLPVIPMYLPGDIGVYSVYPSGYPDTEFAPIPFSIYNIWKRERLVGSIRRNFYSVSGNKLIFYGDLPGSGVDTVDMKLCVSDVSSMDNNSPLPIPPELEEDVVRAVVELFQEPRTERLETIQPSPAKSD